MRPYEICSRPKFICEGLTRFDVEQGEAIFAISATAAKSSSSPSSNSPCSMPFLSSSSSNCNKTTNSSLLSAISCLTLTPKLLDRVVPPDQTFGPNSYSGIFRFRFWKFGEWTEVVIDDRLPTYKGRLLFLRSVDPTEFWAALLEKAYAKFYGSYETYLKNCFTAQTLQDLTGGIAQSFTIPHHDGHIIYQMISSAVPRSTLLSVCISSAPQSELNGSVAALATSPPHPCVLSSSSSAFSSAISKLQPIRLRNGLITRQSYSITGLARVRTTPRPTNGYISPPISNGHHHHQSHNSNCHNFQFHNQFTNTGLINGGLPNICGAHEVILIRLRNAWGKGEWNGPWSERSWEWDHLNDRDKEELSLRCRDDGEFWMSFDDFLRYFTHLDLVHIGPDDWMQESTLHHKRPWRAVLARRRWRKGFNAGGAPNYKDTFTTNPQFHIHIPKNDSNKCHVVVSVTQSYETTSCQQLVAKELHAIGFCVYEIPSAMKRLTQTFVTSHRPLDVTAFTSTRETVTFFTLPPGDFIIVPSTEKPNLETKFLLRILTDEPSTIWEVNEDNIIFPDVSIPKVVENNGQNGHNLLSRLMAKIPNEIDAFLLLKILKAYWKPLSILYDKPSLELCRYLIMLKDNTISGKIMVKEALPNVLNLLHFWRTIFTKYQNNSHHKVSSYTLRSILWETGISVSNKVLECLVIRYSQNSTYLTLESFLLILVKLHLAHDRYRNLERKSKNNSLTLEEMILLTVYS
ncbi:Calpain-1 catalytic subunit-like protein [Dinothrombium tinctorium]|uniref:Calpain-1 catalytic subunit-like protein n=1 Tax=Dinothrombium tinctorium TaxID=1965070 RepID=A0A443RN14_9ACAR|nr:Calpain-1 catalytic subunit-like protein [Dinothrombium tinctorium]